MSWAVPKVVRSILDFEDLCDHLFTMYRSVVGGWMNMSLLLSSQCPDPSPDERAG
jgi:hypothetical protein